MFKFDWGFFFLFFSFGILYFGVRRLVWVKTANTRRLKTDYSGCSNWTDFDLTNLDWLRYPN